MTGTMQAWARLRRTLGALSLFAPALVPAAASPSTADALSRIAFTAMQMDVPVEGAFHKFNATIEFDPTNPGQAKVALAVDLGSVDTGSADGDKLLKGPGFFDVARFPRAEFVADSVAAAGSGKYLAHGRFTLKGHSGDLAVPFSVRSDADGTWFEGTLPISRLAYSVGEGEWSDTGTLSDEVQVRFKLHVRR